MVETSIPSRLQRTLLQCLVPVLRGIEQSWALVRRGGPWATLAVLLAIVAITDYPQLLPTVDFATRALLGTAPFILFAVLAVALLKATGAELLLARAFAGREARMIVLAAMFGGLSPFCSCEVIPFVAAMLAAGVPLSAVMAFWLASPLMDPAMFLITMGTLGPAFAIAKTVIAVFIGILGGFVTSFASGSPIFARPLRDRQGCNSCSSAGPVSDAPVWNFWSERERRQAFIDSGRDNFLFLLKWLAFAYVVEALMIRYVPAELIAAVLGGEGVMPILMGALVGAPAYLNGYAAVPLVDALLQQGMAPGAAMSFVVAGGISSIPAAIAVWALVKPRVFAAYLTYAVAGATLAGFAWSLVAALL